MSQSQNLRKCRVVGTGELELTLEDVDPEWVHGSDVDVDANVELVAVDEERIVHELLHEAALPLQVEVLHGLDADATMVLVLLHEQLGGVGGRVRLEGRDLRAEVVGTKEGLDSSKTHFNCFYERDASEI